MADDYAYTADGSGGFGVTDLATGAYTFLGSSGTTLSGLGESGGNLYGGQYGGYDFYQVNGSTGAVSTVFSIDPSAGYTFFDTGSTTAGIYVLDWSMNLYGVNLTTDSLKLIGATGIARRGFTGMSAGGSSLYIANGGDGDGDSDLYSINLTTGAATLVGGGGGPSMMGVGAMVFDGSSLYAGVESSPKALDTLDTTSGAATFEANSNLNQYWYGLAPGAPPPTPEPLTIFGLGVPGLALVVRRMTAKAPK